jgi:hypothetical protein
MRALAKFLLGAILAIAGLGTIGFIGISTGNITIIFGDDNEVDNGNQSEAVEPAKPLAAEIKRKSPAPQPSMPALVEPAIKNTMPTKLAHARRTRYVPANEPDDECSCPLETEPEPQRATPRWVRTEPKRTVYPSWVLTSPTTSDYSVSEARSEAYVNGSRSVSVSTTTINGRITRRRVIVDGQIVVDQ